ncbi:MAG: type II toxin-antitoxin system death-on-curing family toxin [Bacteroidales bacterium]|nr:type II toxin-antitoxin system death-on-curing family toxin [Bacteroidales bacterium]
MIDVEVVLNIHEYLIDRFGGQHGVRDIELLESAIARPFQTFDQKDLHETTIDKAAALIESIVTNHPFLDGNKRTGYVLMRLFLMDNDLDITATQDQKYNFVLAIAKGEMNFDQIKAWLLKHTKNKPNKP